MNRDELIALASKVEALSGPCRETDALVGCAVDTDGYNRPRLHATTGDWFCFLDAEAGRPLDFKSPPAFTASLDAAMSLVRDGLHGIEAYTPEESDGRWAVYLFFTGDNYQFDGEGATYPLALTAAALRSIAEGLPQ